MNFGSWINPKRNPLTTRELLVNTDKRRISRAFSQISIKSYTQQFILKKLSLFQKIKSFFTKDKVFTLFVRFEVETFNKTNDHKHKVILVVPYMKDMNTRKLSELPIQVYSSTRDFKFRMAYNLHLLGNVYTDEVIIKKLGEALTVKPTVVVPKDLEMFDKHLYYVISNIDRLKVVV